MNALLIDGNSLDVDAVLAVARFKRSVKLCPLARARMNRSLEWVLRAARGEVCDEAGESLPVYGVNTGYGSLARVRIGPESISALSYNLIRSHAAGVGKPVDQESVRAMMLLRANALAKGASGCRPELVETVLAMLNAGLIPEVPSQGSCGSSGDLAPLCHLGLVVFRGVEDREEESGHAWLGGERLTGLVAMRRAGLARLQPGPKEGLAMSNGAQLSTGLGAVAIHDAEMLVISGEIAAAMSWEALCGVTRALHPSVHALRPFPGAIACAANLRTLLAGSNSVDSLSEKLQDAYSLRCTPQVVGAVRDGLRYAKAQISIELNAATDNPLILVDEDGANKAYSAGLFHGEPVGMACDHLKLAISELGAISERRIYRLTTGSLSGRLPALLVRGDAPSMGMMVPQTTAASLVSENRSIAYPSSVDSIPTCEDQEDHVAMSTTAARLAYQAVKNSRYIVAIELLSAAHGIWWRQREDADFTLGQGTQAALLVIESVLGGRQPTVCPSEDIEKLATMIQSGDLRRAVEASVGALLGVDNG